MFVAVLIPIVKQTFWVGYLKCFYSWLTYLWQTDTTVLNPVISPKSAVARFTQICESNDLHEIQLTQKRLCWSGNVLHRAFPCLPTTTVLGNVVVPMLSPLPQCLRNVVEKLDRHGRNTTSWKPIRSSPTQYPIYIYINYTFNTVIIIRGHVLLVKEVNPTLIYVILSGVFCLWSIVVTRYINFKIT